MNSKELNINKQVHIHIVQYAEWQTCGGKCGDMVITPAPLGMKLVIGYLILCSYNYHLNYLYVFYQYTETFREFLKSLKT